MLEMKTMSEQEEVVPQDAMEKFLLTKPGGAEMVLKLREERKRVLALEAEMGLKEGWQEEFVPTILPPHWRLVQSTLDGAQYACSNGLFVIASASVEGDKKRWLHVSMSRKNRIPSWEDIVEVKNTIVGMNRKAIQVLPVQKEYVNIYSNVLHLWACLEPEGDGLPDFTHGTGSL